MAHESTADVRRDLIAGEPFDVCRKMLFTAFQLPGPDWGPDPGPSALAWRVTRSR